MKKLLSKEDGMVLVMVIILATVGIVLFTAIADLAFQNYKTIRANNTRSNVYYIADYGMERVLKNLETIIESAKISANEEIRMSSDYDNIVAGTMDYKTQYETYFKNYLSNDASVTTPTARTGDIATILSSSYSSFNPPIPGILNARYTATVTKSATFTTDYTLTISVSGDNNGKFQRSVRAQVGIDPWGYNNTNTGTTPTITTDDNSVYSSPQWSSALASSGNILVSGGAITVNGDVFVNGKGYNGIINGASNNPVTGLPYDGSLFGGLVVGDVTNSSAGNLTVNGNLFSNNYVHTQYPGSVINVKARPSVPNLTSYNLNIGQIYDNTSNPYYSEKASNLNDGTSNNPLSHIDTNFTASIVDSIGARDTNPTYINYIKNTYGIQKLNGGFIYSGNIQIDRNDIESINPTNQQIWADGSAILYDNLEVDSKGIITISNNFYGFRDSTQDFNDSSSIITNSIDGQVNLLGRVYNAGAAFVTAYKDSNLDGIRQSSEEIYMTGETASIYKNFYAYKSNLSNIPIPVRSGTSTQFYTEDPTNYPLEAYNPLALINFNVGSEDYNIKRATHILAYDHANPSSLLNISNGGLSIDKRKIILNSSIYSDSLLGSMDMGFANGTLMGTLNSGTAETFTGYLGLDAPDPTGFIDYYRARRSLSADAFNHYIAGKYSTLMGIKALKFMDGSHTYTVDLREIVDTAKVSGWHKTYTDTTGMDANYIVADGNIDITIDADDKNMIINYGGASPLSISKTGNKSFDYNGLILATGKITIDSNSTKPIIINGAVVSTIAPDNTGIEFKGAGKKQVDYNQNIMLNIFKLPTEDAQSIKEALSSKRGIVEIFKKVYAQQKYIIDNGLTGDTTFKQGVDDYANSYMDNSTTPPTLKPIPLSGNGSDTCALIINGQSIDVPVAAITAVANLYEIFDPTQTSIPNYNDKFVLYQSVLSKLTTQGSKNYKIKSWGSIL